MADAVIGIRRAVRLYFLGCDIWVGVASSRPRHISFLENPPKMQ